MEKLLFWWHYITKPSFRAYVHLHDVQSFYNDIENRRRNMLEYQSRSSLIAEFGENARHRCSQIDLQVGRMNGYEYGIFTVGL